MRSQLSKAAVQALPAILILLFAAFCGYALVRLLDPEELNLWIFKYKARSTIIEQLPTK
jgi:hypothetical protein